VFKLPKELRRYKLIQYRRLTAKPPHKTPGGRGYTYYIREMLRHAIKTEKIPFDAHIKVKLSLDAVVGKRSPYSNYEEVKNSNQRVSQMLD